MVSCLFSIAPRFRVREPERPLLQTVPVSHVVRGNRRRKISSEILRDALAGTGNRTFARDRRWRETRLGDGPPLGDRTTSLRRAGKKPRERDHLKTRPASETASGSDKSTTSLRQEMNDLCADDASTLYYSS